VVVVFVLVLTIPTLGYFLVKQHTIQTLLVQKILENLSEKTGTTLSIDRVKFSFFSDLVLKDLYVADQYNDTLLFVEELRADFDSLNYFGRKIHISKLKLSNPVIHVKRMTDTLFNFTFLVDSLIKKDSVTQNNWDVKLSNVAFKGATLDFTNTPDATFKGYKMLDAAFDARINSMVADSVDVWVRYLGFRDTSAFRLDDFAAKVIITPRLLSVKSFIASNRQSEIDIPEILVEGDQWIKNLTNPSTAFSVQVNSAKVAPDDILHFYPRFPSINGILSFQGLVDGTVGDFKGSNLNVVAGDAVDLVFDFSITGLPDVKYSFVHTDFKRMRINPKFVIPEIEAITKREMPFKKEFSKAGRLMYRGNLTGFFGDFVAFGELNSNFGDIRIDLLLRDNAPLKKLEMSGNVQTEKFNVGALLAQEKLLGNVSLNTSIEADKPYDNYLSMFINGEIFAVEVNGYNYTNVYLKGVLGNKHFNGGVNINDPNLSMLFAGRVDFSEAQPVFDFEADIKKVRPYALNLSKRYMNGELSTTVKTTLRGAKVEDLEGFLGIHNLMYTNENGAINTKNATFMFDRSDNGSSINVKSDWINGNITGRYKFGDVVNSFADILRPVLPTLSKSVYANRLNNVNRFTFNIQVKDFDKVARVLEFPFAVASSGTITGEVDDKNDVLSAKIILGKTRYNAIFFDNITLNLLKNNQRKLDLTVGSSKISMNKKHIENVNVNMVAVADSLQTGITWKNSTIEKYEGDIKATTYFSILPGTNSIKTRVNFLPSSLIIADTLLTVNRSFVEFDTTGVLFNNLRIDGNEIHVYAFGKLSKKPEDIFNASVKGLELEFLTHLFPIDKVLISGILNGDTKINSALSAPLIQSDVNIDDFTFNGLYTGNLSLVTKWNNAGKRLDIRGENKVASNDFPLIIDGAYFPASDSLSLHNKLRGLHVNYIQPYLQSIMQNMKGAATGDLWVGGNIKQLKLIGNLFVKDAGFDIDYLKTSYRFSDTIHLVENGIAFNNITVFDKDGNKGQFSGNLYHTTFKNMEYDMYLLFNKMLVMNTKARDNDLYYGTVYGTGVLSITGKGSKVHIDVNARTNENTAIYVPLSTAEVAGDNTFVSFVSRSDTVMLKTAKDINTGESGFTLNMEVEATPDAGIELIFDSRVGDIIKGRGNGNLVFVYDSQGDFKMFGDYSVTDGEYLFTLQNVINKKFDIEPGGTIRWNGDPYNATINLNAYYKTKASVYDLLPGTIDDMNRNRRIPVNCRMILTENLMSPDIGFDIELPTADPETQQSVKNVLNSKDEVSRQVLSLLMLNRFYTPDYLRSSHISYSNSSNQSQAAVVTGTEFLSNQLSNWLSQISNDFDLGVNYRPADEITSQEVEVILSSQLFDNRVTVNGNFGYRETFTSTSNFVGDFDIDYRLNPKGNLKLKAYSHSNDNIIYESSPTTQGVGFVFKEEFNTFGELMDRYKAILKRKEENTPKPTTKEPSDTTSTSGSSVK
jgi:hypothetical protein